MVKWLSRLTVNQLFLVRVQIGTQQWPCGGTVDTLVLETNVVRRESSNLSEVTDMVRTRQCVKIGSANGVVEQLVGSPVCKTGSFRTYRFKSYLHHNMPEWRKPRVYNLETRCILEGAETEMDCV